MLTLTPTLTLTLTPNHDPTRNPHPDHDQIFTAVFHPCISSKFVFSILPNLLNCCFGIAVVYAVSGGRILNEVVLSELGP
jgi:hypothetical protein